MDEEEEKLGSNNILALCLSSRKNLCIHPEVSKEDDRLKVDSSCRALTASWVRDKILLNGNGHSYSHPQNQSKMLVDDIEDLG